MKQASVDKGFELNYYNLSYRRRFIRTLWMIPLIPLVLFLLWRVGTPMFITIPVAATLVMITYIQASHNYKKWKEEAKK